MKSRPLILTVGAVWLVSGCGARTSDDEFLGYQGGYGGSGGHDTASGSTDSGSGGIAPTGGSSTGGFPGSGGIGGYPFGSGGDFSITSCCETHDSLGCEVTAVEECTCGIDDFCCATTWDSRCIEIANNACFAGCFPKGAGGGGGTGSTGGIGGTGSTGSIGSGGSTGGIGGTGSTGSIGSGGSTGGIGGTGSTGGIGGTGSTGGDCCDTHSSTGCQDTGVTKCVCSLDDFCCNSAWDELCVQEAGMCGATCSGGSGGSTGAGGSGGFCGTAANSGSCSSCLCDSCSSSFAACEQDAGCLPITWCIQASSCLPFNCYQPGTCQKLIDQFGGLTGNSTQLALGLGACALTSSCGCQ